MKNNKRLKEVQKVQDQKDWEQRVKKRVLKALTKISKDESISSLPKGRGRKGFKKVTSKEVVELANLASKFYERRFLEKMQSSKFSKKDRSNSYEGSTTANAVKH